MVGNDLLMVRVRVMLSLMDYYGSYLGFKYFDGCPWQTNWDNWGSAHLGVSYGCKLLKKFLRAF